MKIWITGKNGQLGQSFVRLAQNTAHQVTATDLEELDLSRAEDVKAMADSNPFDLCINCAAYTNVDQAESEADEAMKGNVTIPENLAVACEQNHALLIHFSTDYVFDGMHHLPYIESDTPNPLSVYGSTKYQGELIIKKSASRSVIFRTSWLYSAMGKNFVKTIIGLAKQHNPLRVVFDQVGAPTLSDDLALAIWKNLEQLSSSNTHQVYHFSNLGVTSWYDLAVFIMRELRLRCDITPIRSEAYPQAAKRPAYSVLDTSLFRHEFSYPIPHWTESLQKILDHLRT